MTSSSENGIGILATSGSSLSNNNNIDRGESGRGTANSLHENNHPQTQPQSNQNQQQQQQQQQQQRQEQSNQTNHQDQQKGEEQTKPPSPPSKKKKKPIQHLIAGGTAGFVESSVCHPLDTIKTRMQLRRQNTTRKVVQKNVEGVMGRALGSMRDADSSSGGGGAKGGGEVGAEAAAKTKGGSSVATKVEAVGKGALHRSTTSSETVRVKPNVASSTLSSNNKVTSAASSALHDVGWKQRVPPSYVAANTATTTTTTSATTTTVASASSAKGVVQAPLGPFGTARRIIQREGPLALYKGLTAVYTGIVPKMAIRFVSFEYYRDTLGGWYSRYNNKNTPSASLPPGAAPPINPSITFTAGLLSGLTEAILIVTPAEVCKIRMQSQYHSLIDPSQKPQMNAKYKNVVQTAALIVKEEGVGALYKGVVPTMLRQGCNQAVNFTAYNYFKKMVLGWKKRRMEEQQPGVRVDDVQLDHWQSLMLGGLSGGMGPLVNNPLDVVKTRMQKQVIHPGKEPKYKSLLQSCVVIAKEEGTPALWKGITPRLMRIMPGQAITFMTYEAVSARMESYGWFDYDN